MKVILHEDLLSIWNRYLRKLLKIRKAFLRINTFHLEIEDKIDA
jgi:hypothetical protein